MVTNIGLLCLIIDGSGDKVVSGRIRLQKTAYFCQYLGWPLRDYRLHYYGPYSQTLAETVASAESAGLVSRSGGEPREFRLTDGGREVLALFVDKVCDRARVDKTRRLARRLSDWPPGRLELAATIDYVASGSRMSRDDLLDKVRAIKPAHRKPRLAEAYAEWATSSGPPTMVSTTSATSAICAGIFGPPRTLGDQGIGFGAGPVVDHQVVACRQQVAGDRPSHHAQSDEPKGHSALLARCTARR